MLTNIYFVHYASSIGVVLLEVSIVLSLLLDVMNIIVVLESKTKVTSEPASMTNTEHILIVIVPFVENAEYM